MQSDHASVRAQASFAEQAVPGTPLVLVMEFAPIRRVGAASSIRRLSIFAILLTITPERWQGSPAAEWRDRS